MNSQISRLLPALLSASILAALSIPALAHDARVTGDASHTDVSSPQTDTGQQTTTNSDEQETPSRTQEQKNIQNLSTVVVTGTRTGGHTVKDSLQPISVVSEESIKSTGFHRMTKALSRRVPSMNYTNAAGGDLESFNRAFTLRSLPASDTLVLVNGVRWHKSALIGTLGNYGQGQQFVDLNSIPASAIARVEVLQNGASAQYGSDAIAGVINIILKKGPGDNSVSGSVGQYSAGDGFNYHVAGSFGMSVGSGWLRLSVQHTDQNLANRAHPDRRVPELGTKFVYGLNPFHASNILLNGQIPISDNVKFYTIADYGRKEGTPYEFYRYGYNTPFPRNPAMKSIYPDGFLPHQLLISRNRALVLGLRGETGSGWHWDTAISAGGNKNWDHTMNTMNFALFHDTGSSPTHFYDGSLEAKQQAFSINFRKPFDVGWLAGPLNVAFGGLWLRNSYRVTPGELGSYYTGTSGVPGGAQGFAGWAPSDAVSASRRNYGIYLQLKGKLTKKFTLSVAGRHSHYSDFGNNFSYAVSGRFAFTPTFAMRGTVSTGFRAPTVGQESYTNFSSHFESIGNPLNLPVGIYLEGLISTQQPLAQLLGATPLEPVKSHNYSLGFVWTPNDKFSTTLDFYQVKLDGRMAISSVISVSGDKVRSYLASHGITQTNVVGIRYFTNAGKVRSRGVDLVMSYDTQVGNGTLFSALTADYHKNKVLSVRPNPPVLDSLGVNFKRLGRSEKLGLVGGGSAPKGKLMFSERYDTGHWEFGGYLTRYGEYTSYNSTIPALDQTYSAEWVLDLNVTYYSGPWSVTVGSNNVGNNYPDRTNPEGGDVHGAFPYSQLAPFGFNGAYYYASASYHW